MVCQQRTLTPHNTWPTLGLAYTLSLCRGHSWRVRLAKQEMLSPPGHLVSPLVCRGPWMSIVVLYCWCHSDSASVLLYFTLHMFWWWDQSPLNLSFEFRKSFCTVHILQHVLLCYVLWATSSGTKVRTIVTLVPAEQGRYRPKLRQLNLNLYPSRTRTGPWVTLVATHATMHMPLFWKDGNYWACKDWAFKNERMFGRVSTINGTGTLLFSSSRWSHSICYVLLLYMLYIGDVYTILNRI